MYREIAGVRPNRMGKLSDSARRLSACICNQIAATGAKRERGWARRAKRFGSSEDTLEELFGSPGSDCKAGRRGAPVIRYRLRSHYRTIAYPGERKRSAKAAVSSPHSRALPGPAESALKRMPASEKAI